MKSVESRLRACPHPAASALDQQIQDLIDGYQRIVQQLGQATAAPYHQPARRKTRQQTAKSSSPCCHCHLPEATTEGALGAKPVASVGEKAPSRTKLLSVRPQRFPHYADPVTFEGTPATSPPVVTKSASRASEFHREESYGSRPTSTQILVPANVIKTVQSTTKSPAQMHAKSYIPVAQQHTCTSGSRHHCAACRGSKSVAFHRYLNRDSLHLNNLRRDVQDGVVKLVASNEHDPRQFWT